MISHLNSILPNHKKLITFVFLLLVVNAHSNPQPRIVLSKNYLFNSTSLRDYFSIGCIGDSLFKNKKISLALFGYFNTFKQGQNSKRNYVEGVTGACLYKLNYKHLDLYIGPSLNYRYENYKNRNFPRYYNERIVGLGIYSCLVYNFSKRVSIATETNFHYRRKKITEGNTSTGLKYSRINDGPSSTKYFSLAVLFNF